MTARRRSRYAFHRGVEAALSSLLVASSATAADSPRSTSAPADSSHGRFDGDLAVVAAAGMTASPRGPRASADVRFRYLQTAGIFATYEDGPLVGSASEPRRALALGVELRPLFLARWATGRELGMAHLDLLIDSLGLELGAVFLQPAGARFAGRPGLQAGLGLSLPFLGRASSPFLGLHAGVRFSDSALSGGPIDGPVDRAFYATIDVGWQQLFGGHVVDMNDPRRSPR